MIFTSILLLVPCLRFFETAKILGVFPVPYVSHQEVYQPIWRELALRGHEVTVISPNTLKENIPNLTEIDIGPECNAYFRTVDLQKLLHKDNFIIQTTQNLCQIIIDLAEVMFGHPKVKSYLIGEDKTFDLVIFEAVTITPLAFGYKYNAPTIGISSFGAGLNLHDAVGNPTHPIISPHYNLNIVRDPTFSDRFSSIMYNIMFRMLYDFLFMPKFDQRTRIYFGDGMPYLGDLEKNISLLLLNVNPVMHMIRPNVPAVVEISQMHIKPKKPLPNDIKEFLDASSEGVVYFSLGSNIKSSNLSNNIQETIKQALRELPFNVLWKYEDDDLPGKPNNVFIKKWLPQQDVLGHPNIKVFVTQGGLQSIEEAIVNEVPMVGMPFFGDQPLNVMRIVEKGVAKYVNFLKMTKDDLKNAIVEVAQNTKYKYQVKKLKSILTDQPMIGLDKAIWWIEYVIRHKGAQHLRSAAINMPYWKYFCLDLVEVLLAGSLVCSYLFWKGIKFICLVLFGRQSRKVKAN